MIHPETEEGQADRSAAVHHPTHYNQYPMECIEVIRVLLSPEEYHGFCIGNWLKYRWRAKHKGAQEEDLKKAAWYVREANRTAPKLQAKIHE